MHLKSLTDVQIKILFKFAPVFFGFFLVANLFFFLIIHAVFFFSCTLFLFSLPDLCSIGNKTLFPTKKSVQPEKKKKEHNQKNPKKTGANWNNSYLDAHQTR